MSDPLIQPKKTQILVADNSLSNLEILSEYLENQAYSIQRASSGTSAWSLIEENPEVFSAVLLDRILEGVDGLEILKRMKKDPIMKTIPVIFQTTKSSEEEILEGIKAGASYYLTKPYTKQRLLRVIEVALKQSAHYAALRAELAKGVYGMQLMQFGQFSLKTLKEADNLSMILARACPAPEKVLLGLSELLINAIEHGNLEIGYAEKTDLIEKGRWEEEINARVLDPKYANRMVQVCFEKKPDYIVMVIEDAGKGFDWKKYLEFTPNRAFDMHGRGIVTANKFSFEQIIYHPPGNKVEMRISLNNN